MSGSGLTSASAVGFWPGFGFGPKLTGVPAFPPFAKCAKDGAEVLRESGVSHPPILPHHPQPLRIGLDSSSENIASAEPL